MTAEGFRVTTEEFSMSNEGLRVRLLRLIDRRGTGKLRPRTVAFVFTFLNGKTELLSIQLVEFKGKPNKSAFCLHGP